MIFYRNRFKPLWICYPEQPKTNLLIKFTLFAVRQLTWMIEIVFVGETPLKKVLISYVSTAIPRGKNTTMASKDNRSAGTHNLTPGQGHGSYALQTLSLSSLLPGLNSSPLSFTFSIWIDSGHGIWLGRAVAPIKVLSLSVRMSQTHQGLTRWRRRSREPGAGNSGTRKPDLRVYARLTNTPPSQSG